MKKEIFKSTRYFTAFDFMISHGQLLLRSSKDNDYKENIDVIFFGTSYIQLFTSLWIVSISVVEKDKMPIEYKSVNSFLNKEENYLFEIETKSEKYYVCAAYLKIYENKLAFNETSLGIINFLGRDKEVITTLSK
ncbi:hypothetical protein CNR22_07575 [Sphingobacteriaceae bacterium]|nr:hypothetical protein CNR22_07575 [Sphingobacteriaceae bacterium]